MKVLVVGSGGREHALCWSLAASPVVEGLWCAPGNPGIADDAELVPVQAHEVNKLVACAVEIEADLVVIGPEAPLVEGLVDQLRAKKIRAFGPTAAAARLEGSKAFAKEFCARHGIPTAAHRTFGRGQALEAKAYVEAHDLPLVIKADGLAAGKGVVVAQTRGEALAALDNALSGAFGEAGSSVVIEEFLEGEEASLFAICDGETALFLGTAQDHKRAFDGDEGPNTGGMGAYSPAPQLEGELAERVMAEIVRPTIEGMAEEGSPYTGFLYAGLMLTKDGPKLIEYNARFGDPEAQVVLPRLMTDLGELMVTACDGKLKNTGVLWHPVHALAVVVASKGYPGPYDKGLPLDGLDEFLDRGDVLVFQAGTAERGDGQLVATGGRVLAVTGVGPDLKTAHKRAYATAKKIKFPGGFYRKDIGHRVLGVPKPRAKRRA